MGIPGPILLRNFAPAASALGHNNTASVRKMGLTGDSVCTSICVRQV